MPPISQLRIQWPFRIHWAVILILMLSLDSRTESHLTETALSETHGTATHETETRNTTSPQSLLGETLQYEVFWNPPAWMFFLPTIRAGEITLHFTQSDHDGIPVYRATATAISSGVLPKLTGLHIHDRFESTIDPQSFCSLGITKITREGKRQRDAYLTFDQSSQKGLFRLYDASKTPPSPIKNLEISPLPACVHDLLSAIYDARLRPLSPGFQYTLKVCDNETVKEVVAKVVKREEIKTPAGTFSSVEMKTEALFGGLFKSGGSLRIWFSQQEKQIPVKFEARARLGSVYGNLLKATVKLRE